MTKEPQMRGRMLTMVELEGLVGPPLELGDGLSLLATRWQLAGTFVPPCCGVEIALVRQDRSRRVAWKRIFCPSCGAGPFAASAQVMPAP